MSLSRQGILGAVLFIGGSVMLYAMVQKVNTNNINTADTASIATIEQSHESTSPTSNVIADPLTTDIETEERILAKKQQQRIANVKEQEKRTQAFLEENQKASKEALTKSRLENEMFAANRKSRTSDNEDNAIEPINTQINTQTTVNDDISRPVVVARQAPKSVATPTATPTTNTVVNNKRNQANDDEQNKQSNQPPKRPIDYTVKRGDGLIKLARQYNVSLDALAAANNISTNTTLTLGQQLTIPSAQQIARLEEDAQKAQIKARREAEREKQLKAAREKEEKRQQELLAQKSVQAKQEAQQKLKQARQTVKETDAKGTFGVQVALASNQQKADEVAATFKKAGYKVSTSATSRGVRVMVGPERGKVAAIALKDKINSDPNVGTTGAWVLHWR